MASSSAALAFLTLSWAAVLAGASLDTSPVTFHAGYMPLFGGGNLVPSPGGRSVRLKLDRHTGSGFVSKSAYHHGFFSASIKLPDDDTAGVVVAFYVCPLAPVPISIKSPPSVKLAKEDARCFSYRAKWWRHEGKPCEGKKKACELSNADVFPGNHDEVDFELLGNRRGHEWRIQTNIYGNGSTSRGREERYLLPFDPTLRPHAYAVAWTPTAILFYVDGTPIREVVRVPAMGGDFPSKPMSVYATIWDGSAWATEGGRYKVDYAFAPFAADFSSLVLSGCGHIAAAADDDAECQVAAMTADCAVMTPAKRAAMRRFRRRYLLYTVCHDMYRYNGTVFPECDADDSERHDFHRWGESKRVSPSSRGYKQPRADKAAAVDVAVAAPGRPDTWPVIGTLRVD